MSGIHVTSVTSSNNRFYNGFGSKFVETVWFPQMCTETDFFVGLL